MSFDSVSNLQNLIALVLAFIPIAVIGGYLQAKLSTWLGDDSAEKAGYATFDVGTHFSILSLILIAFTSFGLAPFLPRNPNLISGRYAALRKILLFLSGAIVFGFIFIMIALFFVGTGHLLHIVSFKNPMLAPYITSLLKVFLAGIHLSVFLLELKFFFGIAYAILYFCFPQLYDNFFQTYFAVTAIVFILLFFYRIFFHVYVVQGLIYFSGWLIELLKSIF
jgi:hypothetical protein